MPFYLEEKEILPQVAGLRSVLIVPCRFCPAASFAVKEDRPYLELLRKGLRTEAYESFIERLQGRLQAVGIRTDVFDSRLPHQFVACMWTARRRRQLAARAAEFDGVVALGCDATVETVRLAIGSAECRVIPGMAIAGGIMNVRPVARPSGRLSLKLLGITALGTSGPAPLFDRKAPV